MFDPKITMHKGGTAEKTVNASQIVIPDLWHIAQSQPDSEDKKSILEVWHLAHELLKHIRNE